jgi:hypothetical protein
MAVQPPVQPGQLSPDGMWRWDGVQWVPTMPVAPHRSRAWIWWLAGALAVSLLLLLAGAGYGVYSLATKFQTGGFSCLPSDFPAYPGASVVAENTTIGGSLPSGTTRECSMTLAAGDDVATVTSFYEDHLNSGDWSVTGTDPVTGDIQFSNRSKINTSGTVELLGHGAQTEIRIVLDS